MRQLTSYGYETALGARISRDPIGEAGGLNLYGYVLNNPVYWIDPLGLAPGDPYPTQEAAAKAGMSDAYNKTTSQRSDRQREYGGSVYKLPDGKNYSYTEPKPGLLNDGKVQRQNGPNGQCPDAQYHSHPSWGDSMPSDLKDKNGNRYGDVPNAIASGIPQYNIGGDGRMWRANPSGTVDYLGQ